MIPDRRKPRDPLRPPPVERIDSIDLALYLSMIATAALLALFYAGILQ